MGVIQGSPIYRTALRPTASAAAETVTGRPAEGRSFLFLQGNVSQFFSCLADALEQRGHAIHKVNFNGGDQLFWRRRGAIDFRGTGAEWPDFFERLLDERAVTDIILFGDCRPLHRQAVEIAKARGLEVWVLEEGYLRPNWITLERGGVNGFTGLPRLPEDFVRMAEHLPPVEDGAPIVNSFARRAIEDIIYHVARVAMMWRFPRYRFHAPVEPFLEYAGWIGRILRGPVERRRARELLPVVMGKQPFYLLPLQLDSDYQIRVHSPFFRIEPALVHIIGSFARKAPADTLLVIKSHPLDNGLTDWRRLVAEIAREAKVADRVIYLEHNNLEELIHRARGIVTINSTVGAVALQFGRPLVALGDAVYNVEGLTFQKGLDRFWTELKPPSAALYAAFRRVLSHHCLVRGSFYSRTGVAEAVQRSVERIEAVAAAAATVAGTDEVARASVA